ncbi:MAG: Nramp family divalent metal transporter, partial [Gemmatimonadetes bacterium]|nr:Nramp family divalent metal transporter [Gemmatimonadota bacterium]
MRESTSRSMTRYCPTRRPGQRSPYAAPGRRSSHYDALPRVPRLRHVVGPSVIALGMGLGAGEFLLWPNIVATGGFQVFWLFWVGVLTQFLVIGEIERWTMATGESVFAGMARLDRLRFWPWFFLLATLVSFFWPGWAGEAAAFVANVIGLLSGSEPAWQPIALVMILVTYVALAGAAIVYNALERFEILLVVLLFPLLLLAVVLAGVRATDVAALARGAVSVGDVPVDFITGARFTTLMIAVAYAGSGGTLMLAQSLWIRDKGFGMGAYQGRIAGIRGVNEELRATGLAFDATNPTLARRFRAWMTLAHRELLVTFVALILLSVVITALIAATTLGTNNPELTGDFLRMVALEARGLAEHGGVGLEIAFLLGGACVLFSTHVGIMDTVTRITGDIFHECYGRRTGFWTLKRTFLLFLSVLAAASVTITLASWSEGGGLERIQPDFLITIAGPFIIASMYQFALVFASTNARRLPPQLAMPTWKRVGMVWAATLWGWFTSEFTSRVILS